MFTFAFIPVHFRPIVNSGFGIAWNTYLSNLNQKSLRNLHLVAPSPPITTTTVNHSTKNTTKNTANTLSTSS
jgi:protein Mpv17